MPHISRDGTEHQLCATPQPSALRNATLQLRGAIHIKFVPNHIHETIPPHFLCHPTAAKTAHLNFATHHSREASAPKLYGGAGTPTSKLVGVAREA